MLDFIKRKRTYKTKGRMYIEAKYLKDAGFDIGQSIAYKINKKKGQIKVKAVSFENSETKRVYKTTGKVGVVPVIDIQTKDVKDFFNSHDNIEVTVLKGNIIFKVKEAVKVKEEGKIIKFKRKDVLYSVNGAKLAKVVNSDQISFFDLFASDNVEDANVNTITKKIKGKAIKMISLFSGAGMLDKGFLDNGNFDIKFAIDMFEKKRLRRYHLDTYRNNIGNHIIEGNVLDLKNEDIPKADFVAGGVPCVKVSKLNTKDNFRDSDKDDFPVLDQFINVVKWSGAKGFLIENVKEFITVKSGLLLDRIKAKLSDFNITYKVINSAELGSAQARKRAFIIGFKDIVPKIDIPKFVPMKTVRDAFRNIEKTKQHHLRLELKDKYLEMAKYVPQGGNGKSVPQELRPNRSFDNFIQRLHYDRQAPTITGIDSDYILHPVENRKPSVSELARIFSMPDDFIFSGSVTSIVTQIKNGVDYKVSSFLANIIASQMISIL